jgi:hypothetical protein
MSSDKKKYYYENIFLIIEDENIHLIYQDQILAQKFTNLYISTNQNIIIVVLDNKIKKEVLKYIADTYKISDFTYIDEPNEDTILYLRGKYGC